jgi:hypothetical protein
VDALLVVGVRLFLRAREALVWSRGLTGLTAVCGSEHYLRAELFLKMGIDLDGGAGATG